MSYMGKVTFNGTYEYIISVDNLLEAWQEFVRGKRKRRDVQEFERDLMTNILALHDDLMNKTYQHSPYHAFNISDPKPRNIHKAMNQFRAYAQKESRNHTKTVWVLKCDIRKFFASIDQNVLIEIINGYVSDTDIQWLIAQIVSSFHSIQKGKGLPLGNLTSQLLVNVYMNEFDQFVKHKLKAKYYIRYADDSVNLDSQKRLW